jgi:hypothetical protein
MFRLLVAMFETSITCSDKNKIGWKNQGPLAHDAKKILLTLVAYI